MADLLDYASWRAQQSEYTGEGGRSQTLYNRDLNARYGEYQKEFYPDEVIDEGGKTWTYMGGRPSSNVETGDEGQRSWEANPPGSGTDDILSSIKQNYGIDTQTMPGPHGGTYIPREVANYMAAKSNSGGGFIKNFLNGPGAVLLPLMIATGGTLAAASAAGGTGAGAGASAFNAGAGAFDAAGLTGTGIPEAWGIGQSGSVMGSLGETFNSLKDVYNTVDKFTKPLRYANTLMDTISNLSGEGGGGSGSSNIQEGEIDGVSPGRTGTENTGGSTGSSQTSDRGFSDLTGGNFSGGLYDSFNGEPANNWSSAFSALPTSYEPFSTMSSIMNPFGRGRPQYGPMQASRTRR